MQNRPIDVVVAGHVCLDLIPQLTSRHRVAEDLFTPGVLTQVGPAKLAVGGCVANTGIALHRLGARTRLLGKVGDDLLGKAVLDALRQVDPSLAEEMIVSVGEPSSYTIVLSPPDVDRGFLHCPGTNDTFTAGDLAGTRWGDTRIIHFGYPPLMRATFTDEGVGLAALFSTVQAAGALVSLDMATPHPDDTNWRRWLQNVLPSVDVFLPSFDEILFMLGRPGNQSAGRVPVPQSPVGDPNLLAKLTEELHQLGAPIVVIKLGEHGLYLSTSRNLAAQARRAAWRDFPWAAWEGRRLIAPCFEVEVVGTTGSGDCTIAGFLWALVNGARPEEALRWATAIGAHCVESADATSNIPSWPSIDERLRSAWPQRSLAVPLPGWTSSADRGVYVAPDDASLQHPMALGGM